MKLIPISWKIEASAEELGLPLAGSTISLSFDSQTTAQAIYDLLVRGMYCKLNHNNPLHTGGKDGQPTS